MAPGPDVATTSRTASKPLSRLARGRCFPPRPGSRARERRARPARRAGPGVVGRDQELGGAPPSLVRSPSDPLPPRPQSGGNGTAEAQGRRSAMSDRRAPAKPRQPEEFPLPLSRTPLSPTRRDRRSRPPLARPGLRRDFDPRLLCEVPRIGCSATRRAPARRSNVAPSEHQPQSPQGRRFVHGPGPVLHPVAVQ